MIGSLSRSLFLLIVVVSASLASESTIYPLNDCKAPSKLQIEESLGQPEPCPSDSEDALCFRADWASVTARFDASGHATSVIISTAAGLRVVVRVLDQLVPEQNRGRFLRRIEKTDRLACHRVYVDEYEYLSIEYSEERCVSLIPAAIKIIWNPCALNHTPPNIAMQPTGMSESFIVNLAVAALRSSG